MQVHSHGSGPFTLEVSGPVSQTPFPGAQDKAALKNRGLVYLLLRRQPSDVGAFLSCNLCFAGPLNDLPIGQQLGNSHHIRTPASQLLSGTHSLARQEEGTIEGVCR